MLVPPLLFIIVLFSGFAEERRALTSVSVVAVV